MTSQTASVGLLGVGHLIKHMVPALIEGELQPELVLSPRNRQVSAELASGYGLRVAAGNAELVETCRIIVLATRPFHAVDAVKGLPWTSSHLIVSLCAGLGLGELAPHVGGASLVRAMPVVAAEFGESPTCIFPDDATATQLLRSCGPVIALRDEDGFEAASVAACCYGWIHALIGTTSHWLSEAGLEDPVARQLASQMFRAAATVVRETTEKSIDELIGELATPRSFTLAGLEVLREREAFQPWREAHDTVLRKFSKPA